MTWLALKTFFLAALEQVRPVVGTWRNIEHPDSSPDAHKRPILILSRTVVPQISGFCITEKFCVYRIVCYCFVIKDLLFRTTI